MVPRPRIAALATTRLTVIASAQSLLAPAVYRGSVDNVFGVLHTKDVVRWFVTGAADMSLQAMMQPIASVHESVTADRVLRVLRERRTQQALVVDEFGGTAGLVTLSDVLSELIGDVGDEFKSVEPDAETLPVARRLDG